MQTRRLGWVLSAAAFAVVLGGTLVSCGSEGVTIVETDGEDRVQPIEFGGANVYLIEGDSGYILVDAGMPGQGSKLDEALTELGVDPRSVQLIVATHGHLDHIGSIAHAQQLTGASVVCHRSLAASLQDSRFERAVPRTKKLGIRLMNYLTRWMSFTGTTPDILVDDEFALNDYGIPGKIVHTPGHSPSSISILLDSGEALIGDLVREEDSGDIGLGAFYEDKRVLLESLEKVVAHEPRIIYLSHGTTTDTSTLKRVIAANR